MSTVRKQAFGTLSDGRAVELYTLRNTKGTEVKVTTWGARLVSWRVMGKEGKFIDVVLGYDDAATYEKDTSMGAIVGRHVNRIGGAAFTLNGVTYELPKNDGSQKQNHRHGGPMHFGRQLWTAEIIYEGVKLTYHSPDGENGYPGNMDVSVVYSLSNDNELSLKYEAVSDKDTLCNLTNHAYFNLDGFDGGSIIDQKIQIFADKYTWVDEECLPDGRILDVAGTPMDFRELTRIGDGIDADFDEIKFAHGYDHNWCIRDVPAEVEMEPGMFGFDPTCPIDYLAGGLKKAAYAYSDKTGLALTTYTTQPGLQFYTGNSLHGGLVGKKGVTFPPRTGFCLETQFYPDALNHPEFPQPILRKGETWQAQTVYVLRVKK
ncbi:MAG: galactose mutarotase [Selenomonadaceae bacterium]|nr:galactose mutarotase [Selenomonadaceae bacterium]